MDASRLRYTLRFLSGFLPLAYTANAWASGDPLAVVVIALVVMVFHVLLVVVILATKNVSWRRKALFATGYLAFMCGWWYVWYVAYTGAHVLHMAFDPFWFVVVVPVGVVVGGRMLPVRIGKSKSPSRSGQVQ